MRSSIRATFVVALLSTSACTQHAAQIELKGQQIFAKNGVQYAVYIPSAGGNYHTPSKYTAPISMGTTQAASTSAISVSELDTPPASVQVKEIAPVTAKPAQTIAKSEPVKSLAPVAVAKAEPVKVVSPEPKTAEIQKINPWTKKPRTEFLEAKNEKPALAPETKPVARAKPVRLSADQSSASFIWPVNGSKILSRFGPKGGGKANDGINIAAASGEPVWAAADGEIVYVGNELQGYGNMVLVKHAGGKTTTYAHLSQTSVDKYDRVHQGDIIGYVGNSGNVKKSQLHFAVRDGDNFVDPMKFVSRSVASN